MKDYFNKTVYKSKNGIQPLVMKIYLKIHHTLNRFVLKHFRIDLFAFTRIDNSFKMVRVGSKYGGWVIPENYINEKSICYCVGCGEDISFDLELIKKYNCEIHAYDPTPRAIAYVKKMTDGNDKYLFHETGLWSSNTTLKFYEPINKEFVSHSALNLQQTDGYFEAEVKELKTIMSENQHDHIDYIKLDIEGAEYEVLKNIVKEKLDVHMISVEYDECVNPLNFGYIFRVRKSIRKLLHAGYRIIHSEGNGCFTLLKK